LANPVHKVQCMFVKATDPLAACAIKPALLGSFSNSLDALHKANKRGFSITNLSGWNRLLLDEGKKYLGTVNDSRAFAGNPYLQEGRGKPFGKTVELEITIGGEKKLFTVRVDRDFIGKIDKVLFFDQFSAFGRPLVRLLDGKGREIKDLRETDRIFAHCTKASYSVDVSKQRWGSDFSLEDGYLLRLFTTDNAAFGLPARCIHFFGGRGVVAGVPPADQLKVFGKFVEAGIP